MLRASLDSGSGNSTIEGAIADFDTPGATGSGTQSDPYKTAETSLRAPEGQVVYYEYSAGSLNDDLGGHVWQLKDMDGETDGGLLVSASEIPADGTVFVVH